MTRVGRRVALARRGALLLTTFLAGVTAANAQGGEVTPTFGDVARLTSEHCATCHRPGGIAPFPLLTHADFTMRLRDILAAIESRAMPPWKPEPGHGEFADARRLPDRERDTLLRWIDAGAPQGDPTMRPAPPAVADGWQLGEPDLVVAMPEAYTVPAGGADVFRTFVLPLELTRGRFVRAWEFRPGNLRVVHHATIGLDLGRRARELDARDPAPGYEGVVPFSVTNPDGYFLGWSPGQRQPQRALAGMSWVLTPGADLVFSMHLRPTGHIEPVQASIGLYFGDDPPARMPVTLRLGRQDIDIPPGEPRYTITNEYTLPVDVDLHSLYPHAHHRARQIAAFARLPNGRRIELLLIRSWDFNWQDLYRYQVPVFLPAHSTVSMEYTYDNAGHLDHGAGGPRRVTYGPKSSDEMGDLWLQMVPRDPRDRPTLIRDFERKLLPETIAGVEMMARLDPGNAALHDEAGLLHQQVGAFDRAAAHFAESLRLHPSAAARNNLGSAWLALGRRGDARSLFESAIADDPSYAVAHYNLGMVLQLDGRVRQAIAHYKEVLRLQPNHGEAYFVMGSALAGEGQIVEAERAYRAAMGIRPLWVLPVVELTWMLATSPGLESNKRQEAAHLATGLLDSGAAPSVAILDASAAAFAAVGRYEDAVGLASRALKLALAARDQAKATSIGARLRLYQRQQGFLAP